MIARIAKAFGFGALYLGYSVATPAAPLQISDLPLNMATVKPNVMLLMDTSGSMDDKPSGGSERKIVSAISAAKAVIAANANMRFGVSRFNHSEGGRVDKACGSTPTELNRTLDSYANPNGWTPVAETLYEVTRYFRGMDSYYNHPQSYASPVQYRCQKNFVIVLTDGAPTQDKHFPNNDPADTADPHRALPNWDGVANDNPQARDGKALYLDDIAKFAWDLDVKTSGDDLAGVSFQDEKFKTQNIHTYTVGFAIDHAMLKAAAEYGHGAYYLAENKDQLSIALNAALADISKKSFSSSAIAASGGRVQSGLRLFQARYDSADWAGKLLAFNIISDSTSQAYGQLEATPVWDAGEKIPNPDQRTIITNRDALGVAFRPDNGAGSTGHGKPPKKAQKNKGKKKGKDKAQDSGSSTPMLGGDTALLAYLRGEEKTGYRRRSSPLGDIINSNPAYVGSPSARYPESSAVSGVPPYAAFRKRLSSRAGMVYVGANDGMLHGFDAASGVEKLAYIPGSQLPRLHALASPDYSHRYFVDGSPTVVDAVINNQWRTILVGGLNAGGQSIFALDITDPTQFSEAQADAIFLWEFSDKDHPEMGYSFSRPAIVQLQDGKWYAVFGNGYNNTAADEHISNNGDAVLYLVDLASGALVRAISTDTGMQEDPSGQQRPNGFSTVTPVDEDGDYRVDVIYGGDLFGNVWKFNLQAKRPTDWALEYKLFQACGGVDCGADNVQAITSRVTVARAGSANLVLFGTGKYFEQTDNQTTVLQSFYGIWDRGQPVAGRRELLQQRIEKQQVFAFKDDRGSADPADDRIQQRSVRTTSANTPDSRHQGWYLDLQSPDGIGGYDLLGERIISRPVIRGRRVVFVTTTPSADPCAPGGYSWLMELDKETGARLRVAAFDLNGDGMFSDADHLQQNKKKTVVSGVRLNNGGAVEPNIVVGDGREFKHVTGGEQVEVLTESLDDEAFGRQSWLQLKRN